MTTSVATQHKHSHSTDSESHCDLRAHAGHANATWGGAASATLHCLTGCAIGEFVGLAIGVQLGLGMWQTMALATTLAFTFGYALTLIPFMRRGVSFMAAMKVIWLGETISMTFMEIAINFTDYHMGGMSVDSLADPQFWLAYAVALLAGFLAAWPVNYWLLGRSMKSCH